MADAHKLDKAPEPEIRRVSRAQADAKAKATAVDASPNAAQTPSGAALKKVAGIADDTERGEKYLREKTARRWGYVPAES